MKRIAWLVVLSLPACVLADTQGPPAQPSATRADGSCRDTRQKGDERPNFVFILTDDQQLSTLSVMTQTKALLADSGLTFANAFVTLPVCCPSRASILRGQYAHNHGVVMNFAPDGGWPRFRELGLEHSTVATWLDDAGYETAFLGKYLNDYTVPGASPPPTYVPPGWDQWFATLGYDGEFRSVAVFTDFVQNENGKLVRYGHEPSEYHTDLLAREAVDFICTQAGRADPFFLYINPHAPHEPAWPAPRHAGRFAGVQAPRPPSFNELDVSDKISFMRSLPVLGPDSIARIDEYYRLQLESLLAVDDLVASVVRALKSGNLLTNTYIFYSSDNGYHLGEHRLPPAKGTAFEEDIRVPLFIRGPAIPYGRIRNEMVLNTDFAPTIAELAGVPAPENVDGRSMRPLLHSEVPQSGWRKAFLIEAYGTGSAQSGIRTADRMYRELNDRGNSREIYDLSSDPYQLDNYVRRADPTLLTGLSRWLVALRVCAAGSCRAAEDSVF